MCVVLRGGRGVVVNSRYGDMEKEEKEINTHLYIPANVSISTL